MFTFLGVNPPNFMDGVSNINHNPSRCMDHRTAWLLDRKLTARRGLSEQGDDLGGNQLEVLDIAGVHELKINP